ncbi:MAG: RNA-binding protein [Acidobacteria bacterium]|nr:MAG: RNA-binding protein [Acidobacteriota bacterium]
MSRALAILAPVLWLLMPAGTPEEDVADYVDIAASARLTARTVIGGETTKEFILESTGGGVALLDYDGDGWTDIFLVNGSRIGGFPGGEEPTNRLYRNNHDGTFTDVTAKAGLVRHGWGQGACAGDYNGDGNPDLFVTYYGWNVLYRNNGDGTFKDVTREAGVATAQALWNTGAAFLDYDRDGRLDLFVAHYAAYEDAARYGHGSGQTCRWKGLPVFCGPRGLTGSQNTLYHNNGGGTFRDVSGEAGILRPGPGYGFTPLVLDYDNDGWPDVYVASDSTASLLFHNRRDGTFEETGVAAGVAYNEDGREQAGMGVAAGDYDNDGWLDILKTNFADDTSTLYHNRRDGTFSDSTFAAGLGVNTRYLGWGAHFLDFNSDGWADILIVNGHVYPEVDRAPLDSAYRQRKILYVNRRDGTFGDVSLRAGPGIALEKSSRGAAFGDLFNTGQVNAVVNNMNDAPTLLHNRRPGPNHALLIELEGTRSNRSAIGARVSVQAQGWRMIDEVRSGGSFCSQNDLRLRFGLGPRQEAESVEIAWPSGRTEIFHRVAADQWVRIREGAGIVASRKFLPPPQLPR